jgi:hypothetical protein
MSNSSFSGLRQLAMVVRDGEAAMHAWARAGIGPFLVLKNFEFQAYRYRGKPGPAPIVSLAFAQAGDLQIEVIEQHNTAPSAYTEFLAAGKEGCQHVAEWFGDNQHYDRRYAELGRLGFTCVHEGQGGPPTARFSYWESGLPGGLMIELAEAQLPGVKVLPDMVAQASVNWDGHDPIRYL